MPGMMRFKKSGKSALTRARCANRSRGYSLVELIMVVAVGTVLTAAAVPTVRSVVNNYRLNSAVAMAKWAIQSTRFQALSKGYNYQVVFDSTNINYQIQNLPSGSTYQNVGSVVPLAAWPMTMNQGSTITFQPNGFVSATNSSFTITYQGVTATLTVSNYGNVTVSCSNGTTTC
jgi:prepilin-type N-terminal cleavage/methylation domain-containing protein